MGDAGTVDILWNSYFPNCNPPTVTNLHVHVYIYMFIHHLMNIRQVGASPHSHATSAISIQCTHVHVYTLYIMFLVGQSTILLLFQHHFKGQNLQPKKFAVAFNLLQACSVPP